MRGNQGRNKLVIGALRQLEMVMRQQVTPEKAMIFRGFSKKATYFDGMRFHRTVIGKPDADIRHVNTEFAWASGRADSSLFKTWKPKVMQYFNRNACHVRPCSHKKRDVMGQGLNSAAGRQPANVRHTGPNQRQVSAPGAPGGLKVRRALIDTGATVTCLTDRVVADLSLMPVSQMSVTGLTGTKPYTAYSFYLGIAHDFDSDVFFHSDVTQPTGIGAGSCYLFHHEIVGPEIPDSPDHEIIVGMDIITKGLLTVYKDTAQFQTPFHPESDWLK